MWCNSYFPHVQNGSPTFRLFKQNQIKVFFKWCQVSQIHKCLHVFQWGVNWNFSCEKLFLEYMQQLSLLPVLNNKHIMKHWTPITIDNIFSIHISETYKFSSVFFQNYLIFTIFLHFTYLFPLCLDKLSAHQNKQGFE